MSEVILKNVKKIYPNTASDTKKKKKAKKGEEAPVEEKVNLQITDKGVVAVQEFNIDIKDKEFIVLVGPSGCGKSTTLRMIAGLEEISEGEVIIDGRVVNDVPPKDRDIAMVFQNYALYPHMTVYENMAFSLKLKKVDKKTIDEKVREAAEILDIIPSYLPRLIQSLSLPPAEVRNAWQRQSGGGGKTENPNRYMDGRVIVSQQGKEAGYPLDSLLLPSVLSLFPNRT